jgi:hypothetical protein
MRIDVFILLITAAEGGDVTPVNWHALPVAGFPPGNVVLPNGVCVLNDWHNEPHLDGPELAAKAEAETFSRSFATPNAWEEYKARMKD